MKDDLTCVITARLGSQRVPRKMVRPFAGSCLLEIALNKVLSSKHLKRDRIYLNAYEDEIKEVGRRVGVQIYNRTEESTREPVGPEVFFGYVKDVPGHYVINVNSCNPMLSIETIDRAIESFKTHPVESLFSVIKRPNFFFDKNGVLLNHFNGDEKYKKTLETKMIDPAFEAGHSIYMWNADRMRREWTMWSFTKDDPYLFEIPPDEFFDIDYPWQFNLAESVYKQRVLSRE